MSRDVVLFHFPFSFCSQKVRLVLFEKRIPWTSRIVDIGPAMENYEAWYMRMNPRGVVPTLQDDGLIVTDSAKIVRYLDEKCDVPRLIPSDPVARERMGYWVDAVDAFSFRELSYGKATGIVGLVAMRTERMRLKRLEANAQRYPDLADAYRAKAEEVRQWFAVSKNPVAVSELEQRLGALLDEADVTLRNHPYLAGDVYSLADVYWTCAIARLHTLFGKPPWLGPERPRLDQYYARMRARPSFALAQVKEQASPIDMIKLQFEKLWRPAHRDVERSSG